MKFLLGKLLFNLGPSKVHRFAEKSQNPRVALILSHYIRQGLRALLDSLKTSRQTVVNGTKSSPQVPIAFSSAARSGGIPALVGSKLNAPSNPKWKSLLNQVITKCSSDSWAAELRRNAAKRLMFGSGSTFALIGFTLAKEPTLLTNKDQLDVICQEIREAFLLSHPDSTEPVNKILSVKDLVFGEVLAKGCNAVVYNGKISNSNLDESSSSDIVDKYNLAIKMMFNYDAESHATIIWKSMHRESVPAQSGFLSEGQFGSELFKLPRHPNIVDMHCAFVDMVPELADGLALYPDALPSRLNRDGLGRNMTFFLVMKRYDCSLRSFLHEQKPVTRTGIVILNQLLEGIDFLVKQGVSHRDLKSDNILLDLSFGELSPLLVITDFGCCLADKEHGLKLPFPTDEVFRGGNVALMAPEVVNAVPGRNTSIDYSKADVWAAGAIAYEILGAKNPFYKESGPCYLQSHNYSDSDLPSLPPACPIILSKLLKHMLKKEPKLRLSSNEAADICQVLLHAPTQWLETSKLPSDQEIIVWVLALGGVTLYNQNSKSTDINPIEHLLCSMFMSRVNFNTLKYALSYTIG